MKIRVLSVVIFLFLHFFAAFASGMSCENLTEKIKKITANTSFDDLKQALGDIDPDLVVVKTYTWLHDMKTYSVSYLGDRQIGSGGTIPKLIKDFKMKQKSPQLLNRSETVDILRSPTSINQGTIRLYRWSCPGNKVSVALYMNDNERVGLEVKHERGGWGSWSQTYNPKGDE